MKDRSKFEVELDYECKIISKKQAKTYLVLETGGLLQTVDPTVPDAVGDGREDDSLAFVGLDREAEVSRQLAFVDPTYQTQVDNPV